MPYDTVEIDLSHKLLKFNIIQHNIGNLSCRVNHVDDEGPKRKGCGVGRVGVE